MELTAFKKFCTDNGLKFSENEPMSRHTSFKTGGNADLFLEVNKNSELSSILKKAKELSVPLTVIGKGTNLLVSDNGIEGAVLSICGLDGVSIDGEYITAGAGAPLTAVCIAAAKAGLSGLEFAYGIPGTVGGALYMNAGAYGGEMSQVVVSGQPPHVARPRLRAHFRTGQRESLYGVFAPGRRQPEQWIISGVIPAWFSSDQSFATFRRSSPSSFTVAIRASHFSQSSPQYAMNSFMRSVNSLFSCLRGASGRKRPRKPCCGRWPRSPVPSRGRVCSGGE